jgi:hypothetical protein
MCFFDLVKEYYRVWLATDCLCELSTFVVANISRRSSDESSDSMGFHIFAHIDTNHCMWIIEKFFCKCFGSLCLSDAGRSKEEK